MYIKGVNLGNWLVLEKWMSPALFAGTDADDEYYLPRQLPKEIYEERIRIHRSEYITERDFSFIASCGMNTVRIPVPYFIFGDVPPFVGCIEELDKAFGWAEKYGLQILIDLHSVPGSQNGFDNGGLSGVCKWSQQPESVAFSLDVLKKLAQRYANRRGLWGIEVINEPVTPKVWEIFDVPHRYPAVDPQLAEGSAPNTFEFIEDFYVRAYQLLRPILPEDKVIVYHDAFDARHWKSFFKDHGMEHVVLDTHQYLMMAEAMGCEQNKDAYIKYIKENYAVIMDEMQQYLPIVCGEWCLFNSQVCGIDTKGGQSVLNGVEGAQSETYSFAEKKEIYRAIADAQLDAWQKGSGYFYWNYKLLLDTVSEKNWIGWDSWDFGQCVAQGWFPVTENEADRSE